MLRLPFPPSLNGLFNNTRRGRAKTKAYEKWINAAGMGLMIQRPHKHEGAVSISIVANPPDRRKRDLDNLLKPVLDLLVRHQVIKDDCTQCVRSLSISLGNADENGASGLDVTVTRHGETAGCECSTSGRD